MSYLLPIYLLARLIYLDGVQCLVLLNKCIGLLVSNLLPVFHEVRNRIVVYMVAETLLELNAVTIGNGNVVHVHTEH